MEEMVMGIYSVARFRGEIYYVAKYSLLAVVQFLLIQKPNDNHPRISHQPMSMQHINIQAPSLSPAPGMLQSTGLNIIQLVSAALSNRGPAFFSQSATQLLQLRGINIHITVRRTV